MKITKQQILSGDEQAFVALLSTCFTDSHVIDEKTCQQAMEQCQQIAEAIGKNEITPVWDKSGWKKLSADVRARTGGDLSPWCSVYLQFCFQLLLPYMQYSQLDQFLDDAMADIRQRLLLEALHDKKFWTSQHPLKILADRLQQQMLGWQPGFGQHSDTLLQTFRSSLDQLQTIETGDQKSIKALIKNSDKAFADNRKNMERFTQRLKATETGKIKSRASQLAVVTFMNQLVQGKQLPGKLTAFLQGHMLSELQLLLIREGLDSATWERVRQLLANLLVLYQLAEGEKQANEKQKKALLELPTQLQDFIYQHLEKNAEVDDVINLVAYDFSQIAANHKIEGLEQAVPIEVPGCSQDLEKKVSRDLLDKSRRYREGQWFLLHEEGGEQKRCQLLLIMASCNQLLFSNFAGQRTLVTDYDNFAYLLSARHIQPLMMHGSVTYCLHRQLEIMLKQFEQRFAAIQHDKAARKQAEAERERREAAEKAEVEAKAIAEQKAAEKQKVLQQEMADDMRRQARLALDSLSIGSWVEFQQSGDAYKRAKLAVRFAATGRFVFVDEDGITVADANRDELVDMLMQGRLKLLESDRKFADRLARIVTDIRASQ